MASLSFAADIRPLFRDFDVDSMKPAGLDLSSYEAVKAQAPAIYEQLVDKKMPCDTPWPADQVKKFKDWMDGGLRP